MCDNKKKVLILISTIFLVSLIFVIFIDIHELKMLKEITNELNAFYFAVFSKIVLVAIAFCISILLVTYLFNKEVNFDYMTGLCSRKKLFFDLNDLIGKKAHFTVCYIDFNDFKHINDRYGHKAGDMLLKEFSRRICLLKHKKITGYRIGGDEFVVVIRDNLHLQDCIESIWKVTEEDVNVAPNAVTKIAFAMGIVENDFVSTADELLKKADSSMYKNKKT